MMIPSLKLENFTLNFGTSSVDDFIDFYEFSQTLMMHRNTAIFLDDSSSYEDLLSS